jgi:hypothetical protein
MGPVRRLDVPGAVLLTAAMAMLVYGIVGTDTHPWGSTQTLSVFGLSFVPMTLGATAGIPPHQAGLASGLLNTARQMGGAIGLAATAAVAAGVHAHSTGHHAVASALTSGYDRAVAVCAGVLVVGALVALLFPAQPGKATASASVRERSRSSGKTEEGAVVRGSQPVLDLSHAGH